MADETPPEPASSGLTSSGLTGSGPLDTVGALAELYLGNVLYALERCAMSLDEDERPLDAAFYRAIGRKLAEAHGRSKE